MKLLNQFPGFNDQGHRKVFWRVKLIPVSFFNERFDSKPRLSEQEIDLSINDIQPNEILKLVNGAIEFIPDQKIKGKKVIMILPGAEMSPGHYDVSTNENTFLTIALNLDTNESNINPFSENDLRDAFIGLNYNIISGDDQSDILNKISNEYKGIELWRYFLALALLFLLVEALLIRLL